MFIRPGLHRVALGLALAVVLGSPTGPVTAQTPPGYREFDDGPVHWVVPETAHAATDELRGAFHDAWNRVTLELGVAVDPALAIRVGRSPEDMAKLAPVGAPPPEYATGVAYPSDGLVLLSLSAPETWEQPDLRSVLTHELSHVALHRAVRGHPLPRWFVEGVAIDHANENRIERIRTLFEVSVRGELLPLDRLSASFPSRPYQVNAAYAQSADIVAFLKKWGGSRDLRPFIQYLSTGIPFDKAVERAFGQSMDYLETRWREKLRGRFQTLPLLLGGGTLMSLIAAFAVFVMIRRRRRTMQKLRDWEREEAERAEALVRLERALAARMAESRADSDPPPVRPERTSDADLPRVTHDGRNHTLH